jgi:hypothetical protein
MIPAYTCPAIADAPTLCIPKENLLQINSMTRKQRDSKSPKKNTFTMYFYLFSNMGCPAKSSQTTNQIKIHNGDKTLT